MRFKGIAAALLLTAATASAPLSTADAASASSYRFWFGAEADNANVGVSTKMIYINRDSVTDDVELSLMPYFSDGQTYKAGDTTEIAFLRAAWETDSDYVKLGAVSKPDLTTQKAPFDVYASYIAVVSPTESSSYSAVSYDFTTLFNSTLKVTDTATDSVPLAYSSATVSGDAPLGSYKIFFRDKAYSASKGDSGMCAEIMLRHSSTDTEGIFPTGSNLRDLNIVVSDRLFGDVNDDGQVDSSDAAMILSDYAQFAVTKSSAFSAGQGAAADVNADGAYDSSDAALILSYYAYNQANITANVPLLKYLDK